nr:unnamed protein product [Callosobruchus analis]
MTFTQFVLHNNCLFLNCEQLELCKTEYDRPMQVSWEEEIKINSRYTMTIEVDEVLYYLARLEINNVKKNDRGEYRAVAKNVHGTATAYINLDFESTEKPKIPEGRAPRFPKKPTIRQEGDVLIMECLLEAYPDPDISWFQSEKSIADSPANACCEKIFRKSFTCSL